MGWEPLPDWTGFLHYERLRVQDSEVYDGHINPIRGTSQWEWFVHATIRNFWPDQGTADSEAEAKAAVEAWRP